MNSFELHSKTQIQLQISVMQHVIVLVVKGGQQLLTFSSCG